MELWSSMLLYSKIIIIIIICNLNLARHRMLHRCIRLYNKVWQGLASYLGVPDGTVLHQWHPASACPTSSERAPTELYFHTDKTTPSHTGTCLWTVSIMVASSSCHQTFPSSWTCVGLVLAWAPTQCWSAWSLLPLTTAVSRITAGLNRTAVWLHPTPNCCLYLGLRGVKTWRHRLCPNCQLW